MTLLLIQYIRHTIVFYFVFNNINCAFFVNESVVKLSEQRTKFLLTQSWSSLKVKLIYSFLMLGSERRQCKDCTNVPMCILSILTALNSIVNDLYHIEFRMDSMHIGTQAVFPHTKNTIFLFYFCIDLRSPLSLFTLRAWIGRHGQTGSDVEALIIFHRGGV